LQLGTPLPQTTNYKLRLHVNKVTEAEIRHINPPKRVEYADIMFRGTGRLEYADIMFRGTGRGEYADIMFRGTGRGEYAGIMFRGTGRGEYLSEMGAFDTDEVFLHTYVHANVTIVESGEQNWRVSFVRTCIKSRICKAVLKSVVGS
jgi:hypothetical protein